MFGESFWLRRLPTESRGVVLTFDDGPDPQTTPLLLKALTREKIPATHFLLGKSAQDSSTLVNELASSGQSLANHGFEHRSFLWRSAACQKDSIRQTDEILRHAQPQLVPWFRPPFGRFNLRTAPVLQNLGYRGVLWSIIIRDWIPTDEYVLWDRLKAMLHGGAIIVLHDGHPTTLAVIGLLPRLADEIARRGWTFLALPS